MRQGKEQNTSLVPLGSVASGIFILLALLLCTAGTAGNAVGCPWNQLGPVKDSV